MKITITPTSLGYDAVCGGDYLGTLIEPPGGRGWIGYYYEYHGTPEAKWYSDSKFWFEGIFAIYNLDRKEAARAHAKWLRGDNDESFEWPVEEEVAA